MEQLFFITIKRFPLAFILLFILFFFTALIVFIMGAIFLLDGFHRPDRPQHPFNKILDVFFPIILLFSPLLMLFTFSESVLYIYRFLIIILLHSFISVPLLCYWSYIRNWNNFQTNPMAYWSWKHPRIFKHIAIALIYPLFIGFYLSFSRYLRLGTSLDISSYYFSDIWVILFTLPYTLAYFYLLFILIARINSFLWAYPSSLLFSFHLYALRFDYYFKFFEWFYKISYLACAAISLEGPVNFLKEPRPPFSPIIRPKWYRLLSYLYFHPYLLRLIIPCSMIIELWFNPFVLYYSLYILFLYPIFHSLLSFFFGFRFFDWPLICCFSDYLSHNWYKPRYPGEFWVFFDNPLIWYNFEWEFTPEFYITLQQEQARHKKAMERKFTYKLEERVRNRNFMIRMAACFRRSQGIRFMHTTRHIPNTSRVHALTGLASRDWSDSAALLNFNYNHYNRLQQFNKVGHIKPITYPAQSELYFPSAYNLNVRPKSIAEFSEHNFLTYFNYNPEKIHAHCYSETYDKFLGFKTQTRPDAILNFKYSPFSFKGYIAIDMKTARSPGLGRSEAIAEINVNAYKKLLDRFESHLVQLKYFTPEIEFLFKRMQENVEDFTSLQNYWFKCVTLLEHTGNIPPLRIPEAFNTKYLLPEQLARYNKAKNKLLAVSELLYKKKISEHYQHPSLPERALDIFEGSEMQNILND